MTSDYNAFLGKRVDIQIDRPLGSRHPRHGYVYPVNYGYIPDTRAGDGEAIDVYLLGAEAPLNQASVVVIGIAHRQDDAEDKLIATLDGSVPSLHAVQSALRFQEQFFDTDYRLIKPIG